MTLRSLLTAAAVAAAPFAAGATPVTPFDLDDIASGMDPFPVTVLPADLTSANSFIIELNGGSVDYKVTVDFALTGNPSPVVASYGVGASSTVLSPIADGMFSDLTVEVVGAGDSLFVNFDVSSIKAGGYTLDITAMTAPQIPVPAALPLIASGLAALGFVGARRRKG
jgi:hypothetical protein